MLRTALRTTLVATLLLAACGEDVEDQPGASVYAGQMTGADTATLAGRAQFGVTLNSSANAGGFALILGDSTTARIVLFSFTTPKPRAGTYEIVAPGTPANSDTVFTGSLSWNVGGVLQQFEIRSGTITLERANHSRTSGTFELRAERTSPPDSAQIVINGSFDAGQIPQVFPQVRSSAR